MPHSHIDMLSTRGGGGVWRRVTRTWRPGAIFGTRITGASGSTAALPMETAGMYKAGTGPESPQLEPGVGFGVAEREQACSELDLELSCWRIKPASNTPSLCPLCDILSLTSLRFYFLDSELHFPKWLLLNLRRLRCWARYAFTGVLAEVCLMVMPLLTALCVAHHSAAFRKGDSQPHLSHTTQRVRVHL